MIHSKSIKEVVVALEKNSNEAIASMMIQDSSLLVMMGTLIHG